MGYRDILVVMDEATSARPRARFAADVAAKFDAQLVGAFPRSQVPAPFLPPDLEAALTAAELQRIRDAHARQVEAAASAARRVFEAAAGEAQGPSDWWVIEDERELAACARRTDLMVLTTGVEHPPGFDPGSAVLAGGGSALIVRPDAEPSAFRRVLVAWNGSRQAARALHAAWPLIGLADEVDVLMVGRGRGGPDSRLQRHFERHGVRPNLVRHDADDGMAGDILRREASERRSDLVVMGFYGRTRLRELILGGASREMLQDPPVPLFVSH